MESKEYYLATLGAVAAIGFILWLAWGTVLTKADRQICEEKFSADTCVLLLR